MPPRVFQQQLTRYGYPARMNLATIPTFAGGDIFHVVVESPRGSALKLKHNIEWDVMSVARPLPVGVMFPYDWGFVPSTEAADGDPLDAMLLWDVASYPGVVIPCRAVGVLQVEQNRQRDDSSRRIRNDRIMAVPAEARREREINEVTHLPARVRQEVEQFTLAATALEGKQVSVLGWGDAAAALQLVRETSRR